MELKDVLLCVAGIAILSAALDLFVSDSSKAFGFRAVCGLAMTCSIMAALWRLATV